MRFETEPYAMRFETEPYACAHKTTSPSINLCAHEHKCISVYTLTELSAPAGIIAWGLARIL